MDRCMKTFFVQEHCAFGHCLLKQIFFPEAFHFLSSCGTKVALILKEVLAKPTFD